MAQPMQRTKEWTNFMNKPKEYNSVSVVICTKNEADNLPHVLPKIPQWVDEIILVDGNSIDSTIKVARQLCPRIRVLVQPGKGKGDAIKQGIIEARGDIIVTLDADGQTNPQEMGELIKPLLNGYDFTKGSRLAKGRPKNMPFHRWLGNSAIALTCNMLYRTKFTDLCSGYNAFLRKRFLDINPWTKENWGYEPLLIARVLNHKLKIIEISHSYSKRINGTSRLPDFKQGLTAILILVRERFLG